MSPEALQATMERGVHRVVGIALGERVPFFTHTLSSVMYPQKLFCLTMHFNYWYFETDGESVLVWG